jgi:pilus assembly protein CpaB
VVHPVWQINRRLLLALNRQARQMLAFGSVTRLRIFRDKSSIKMRRNNAIVLAVALVLGVIAAILARNWLLSHDRANLAQSGTGTIVVAAAPVSFGTQLSRDNVKEIAWNTSALPEGAFATTQELLNDGRRMALASIARNEPVLRNKITAPGERAALSAMLDPGKRAVTVRVDDVRGVAGFIQPGDRVDVVLIRGEAEASSKQGYSDVILQFAKVLAIDQITGERSEQPTIAKAVTLEVGTEDAQKILLAANIGRLSLILRQPAEASAERVRRVTEGDLGGPAVALAPVAPVAPTVVVQAPAPKPAPARTKRIAIWRGTQQQVYERPLDSTEIDGDQRELSGRPRAVQRAVRGALTRNDPERDKK